MKTVHILALLMTLIGSAAGAQRAPRAYLGDSNFVAQNVLRRLFDGIRLSEAQEAEATVIIKRTWRQQFVPKPGSVAEQVKNGWELNAARDSALKALLKSRAEQALFEHNVETLVGTTSHPPPSFALPPHGPPRRR